MATGIRKCRKCGSSETESRKIFIITNCGHPICKFCLPNLELNPARGRPTKVVSDGTLFTRPKCRDGIVFEDDTDTTKNRASEPCDVINPSPGDCPICQQRILCKDVKVNTHLGTFYDFDWIKQVQEKLDPKNCAECPEGQVQRAKYVCISCEYVPVLCGSCKEAHLQKHEGHVLVSLEDIANRKGRFCININGSFDSLHCSYHPNQDLTYYCQNCSEPVCVLCSTHHEELGHSLVKLSEGLKEMQSFVTENLQNIREYKAQLEKEKDKFTRRETDDNITYVKSIQQRVDTHLRPAITAAVSELTKFKMVAISEESKNNVVRASDEIENLCALEKAHEIMHRGKENNVCTQEERIIRLHNFLKSNVVFMEYARRSLVQLHKDAAAQVPDPAVIYNDLIERILKNPAGDTIKVVHKIPGKGIILHNTRNKSPGGDKKPRLVSGTIWSAGTDDDEVQIVVADANNQKIMVFESSTKESNKAIQLKWEKSAETSATMLRLKELKGTWINQDGRSATVVDVEGNACEFSLTNGERRKSVASTRKRPEVAYTQGDSEFPVRHGYNLPKYLERVGIIPHQVLVFSERDTFLVSGLHTGTNKPVILVSRGDLLNMITVWPKASHPCRAWIDHDHLIYCVNTDDNVISRYLPDGSFERDILNAVDELSRPIDVAVDRQYIYVTEEEGNIKLFEKLAEHIAPILETIS